MADTPSRRLSAAKLDQLRNEMDRLYDVMGLGREWLGLRPGATPSRPPREDRWFPDLEMFQRGSELVIRADLPGLSRDDVSVEITDEAVTIQGQRKWEHEEKREGFYRTERRYGSFYRVVALPEGAKSEDAKAAFKHGVLQITIPAPAEPANRGRQVEIA